MRRRRSPENQVVVRDLEAALRVVRNEGPSIMRYIHLTRTYGQVSLRFMQSMDLLLQNNIPFYWIARNVGLTQSAIYILRTVYNHYEPQFIQYVRDASYNIGNNMVEYANNRISNAWDQAQNYFSNRQLALPDSPGAGPPSTQSPISISAGETMNNINVPVVRIPDVNLYKFCKKGDRWNEQYVSYTKKYNRQGGGVLSSSQNLKSYNCLSTYEVDLPNVDPNSQRSVINITTFPESHFNSVEMLEICKADMATATDTRWQVTGVGGVVRNFQEPSYSNSVPYQTTFVNDGNLNCGLNNQIMHIRFKNVTRIVSDVATIEVTNPVTAKVYFVQIMKDLYQQRYVAHNPIQDLINAGFTKYYTDDGGTILSNSNQQPLHIGIHENSFIKDDCRIIGCRKLIIAPGQEVNMVVKVPQRQILSYKYKNRATIATVATPSANTYNPVVCKKGEIFLLVEQYGGLSLASNNNTAVVTGSTLVYFVNKQWDFTLIQKDGQKKTQQFVSESMGTVVDDKDVDMNAAQEPAG